MDIPDINILNSVTIQREDFERMYKGFCIAKLYIQENSTDDIEINACISILNRILRQFKNLKNPSESNK